MNDRLKISVKRRLGERLSQKIATSRRRGGANMLKYGVKNIIGRPTLQEIGEYHQTDKHDGNHSFAGLSYLDIYERYFDQFRDQKVSVLEIGVKDGASHRTWKAYFKEAQIYGIGIDPRCKAFEADRLHIEIGSQDDIGFLDNCFGTETKFDIIIDDGSHINTMILISYENLFNKRLNPGGLYIIEDLGCSYEKLQTNHNVMETWPGMKYNNPSNSYDNDRQAMDTFFLEKIKNLDFLSGNVLTIHFWARTCIIAKL